MFRFFLKSLIISKILEHPKKIVVHHPLTLFFAKIMCNNSREGGSNRAGAKKSCVHAQLPLMTAVGITHSTHILKNFPIVMST